MAPFHRGRFKRMANKAPCIPKNSRPTGMLMIGEKAHPAVIPLAILLGVGGVAPGQEPIDLMTRPVSS